MGQVIAITHTIRAYDHKDDIGHLLRDTMGDPHKNIEATHGFQPASDIGHDACLLTDRFARDPALHGAPHPLGSRV